MKRALIVASVGILASAGWVVGANAEDMLVEPTVALLVRTMALPLRAKCWYTPPPPRAMAA
jgi:hypothetical protein